MEALTKYFPQLSERQLARFRAMEALYREWNERINVISRKDMDELMTHHILHSLAIAKLVDFPAGSTVLDLGTGGGFPGIPLAVLFPEARFTLCDSIGKKVKVAQAVADGLALDNVTCVQARAESLPGPFDYVVSRAVTDLSTFYPWVRGKFTKAICYLKGGDLDTEIADCVRRCRLDRGKFYVAPVSNWFDDPWFEEKKIVTISR
ncbi:MAG: 16S rRNA (guanine(527)-N(7))-methyltransferase RsmG [Bacteroidales bacterium]|nr:16S rRNA (guanine(527)-N(7))-methyltransferase RsmG [Bacteroidales bacterium]